MDSNVYVLTFVDLRGNPHTMTSYGWANVLTDRDICVDGWELISIVRARKVS